MKTVGSFYCFVRSSIDFGMRYGIRFLKIVLFLSVLNTSSFAQIDDERVEVDTIEQISKLPKNTKMRPMNVENVFIGSYFSMYFTSYFFLDISPFAGYIIGDMFAVGVGGTYIYSALFTSSGLALENNIFGGRIFANFRPFKEERFLRGIYAHVEGEYLNRKINPSSLQSDREWVPAVNAGIGYSTQFSQGFSFISEFLINILYFSQIPNGISPVYSTPWQYRIGVNYTF